MIRRASAALAAVVALAAGACGPDGTANAGPGNGAVTIAGELVVLAASSLTEPFAALGREFEARHPAVDVTFSFAGSSDLARQINEGAPADVFAAADEQSMATAVASGRAAAPVIFARNRPAIIVEKGNPKGIRGLADLARRDVVLVVCAPQVPCGRLAAAAFTAADVEVDPASLEANVKAVVSKVTLGEADAGIVYRSDVRAEADHADGIDVGGGPGAAPQAAYPIAVTTASADRAAAAAWVDLVVSARGLRALAAAGFLAP